MQNEYVLSPLSYIKVVPKGYKLGSLFSSKRDIEIEQLNEILPNDYMLDHNIFISKDKLEQRKEKFFSILEEQYNNSFTKLGYIETTSQCPYHCRICPKYSNKILRGKKLEISEFQKVISQLKHQDKIELHLFGDPFCDKDIYEKVAISNQFGIYPSFSTNLVSLKNLQIEQLRNLKIGSLTISIDSYSAEILSEIRGEITQASINHYFEILLKLADFSMKYGITDKIILQVIDMENNTESHRFVQKFAQKKAIFQYYKKQYIHFPLVEQPMFKGRNVFNAGEKLLLYNLLEVQLPFKCFKVWDKKEVGILSDGSIVPCCMSFNREEDLGNAKTATLEEIFTSEKFYEFRKKIWSNKVNNRICNGCIQNEMKFEHQKIEKSAIKYLQSYCVTKW